MIEAVENPLLAPWSGPLGSPPLDRVRAEHVLPAFRTAIAASRAEIAAIAADPAPPDFDNTVAAFERSGGLLARVQRVFWMLSSAASNDAIRAIEGEVSAMLAEHGSAIGHDPLLFARVAAVHEARATLGLTAEQLRLVEISHSGFITGGAGLDGPAKARFAAIGERLGALSVAFGQNVLAATDDWRMVIEAGELDGLPDSVRESAARRADKAGRPGAYLFTLDRGDFEAVLTFSARRDLRERMWRAFTTRCDGGPHDNHANIAEMLRLREESARLLGYPTYADYKLEDSMAATPAAAEALLMRVWHPARMQALEEAAALQALIDADADADADGGGFVLAAWDWRYYAERVRRERYAVDAAAIRQCLTLDGVRDAAFSAARRLYGLRLAPRPDVPVYHPDVLAWEATDEAGGAIGLLYTDYCARTGKHGGAWMGSLRVQEKLDGVARPIVYTVANFAKAAAIGETRLSLDEARTLFHEFGHALHALLSDVTYPSLAGTAVARDFVEFPSKFMEHWILAPEVLRGLDMPAALIGAVGRVDRFGQGFATVEFVASAIVDLALHRADAGAIDPARFARDTLAAIGMPGAIAPRHALPVFTHVFDGGYASAYYSYLWSEVLDQDAFSAFAGGGDIFDRGRATRFRREVLAPGNSREPLASFIAYRGREPEEEALLSARGLLPQPAG